MPDNASPEIPTHDPHFKILSQMNIFSVKIWYNRKRRHSGLNYATIEELNDQINYKNVAKLNVQLLFAYPSVICLTI